MQLRKLHKHMSRLVKSQPKLLLKIDEICSYIQWLLLLAVGGNAFFCNFVVNLEYLTILYLWV